MKDWDTLEKAIQRAEKFDYKCPVKKEGRTITQDGYICAGSPDGFAIHYYQVIFDHNFSRAFFTDVNKVDAFDQISLLNSWDKHLQAMVLKVDPIDYLEGFMKKISV